MTETLLDNEPCEISSETCTHPETIVCEKCPRYPRKTTISKFDFILQREDA